MALQANVDTALKQQAASFQTTISSQATTIASLQKGMQALQEHVAKQTVVVNHLTKIIKTSPTPLFDKTMSHAAQPQTTPVYTDIGKADTPMVAGLQTLIYIFMLSVAG